MNDEMLCKFPNTCNVTFRTELHSSPPGFLQRVYREVHKSRAKVPPIHFEKSMLNNNVPGYHNPMELPLQSDVMGSIIKVNITVFHNPDGNNAYPVDQFLLDIPIKGHTNVDHLLLFTPSKVQPFDVDLKARLALSYAVECRNIGRNMCGAQCNQSCRQSPIEDSVNGHYERDSEGNIYCLPGWTDPSTNCTKKSLCFDNPCYNGGTCTEAEDNENVWCDCLPDYEGFLCEQCTKCKNDGICILKNGVTTCDCTLNYDGETCENEAKICDKLRQPCKNGGTCFNIADGYMCNCATGFTGRNCMNFQESENRCKYQGAENQCQNSGTCFETRSGFNCSCSPGTEGRFCEMDTDECKKNPCDPKEQCINTIGSYYCLLEDKDECEDVTCENGGQCVDLQYKYYCMCPDGFSGTNCQFIDKSEGDGKIHAKRGLTEVDKITKNRSNGSLFKPSLALIIGLAVLINKHWLRI